MNLSQDSLSKPRPRLDMHDNLLFQKMIQARLDEVVNELLNEVGIEAPPINSFQIAQHLGWEIILDEKQQSRGRLKRIDYQSTIFLKPDDRPERLQWALAHEIGESLSSRWSSLFDEDELAHQSDSREQLANLFATRLLLPEQWFATDVTNLNHDLLQLKEHYLSASCQLIAFRLLDLPEQSIITIFDQGELTIRRGNLNSPPALQPLERECWQKTHHSGATQKCEQAGLLVECWPIHEADWKREIMRTRPTSLEDY